MSGHICPDGRHDERAAAHYLGVQPGTLRAWRARDQGPAYIKAGRIWYSLEDMDVWLAKQRYAPANDQE